MLKKLTIIALTTVIPVVGTAKNETATKNKPTYSTLMRRLLNNSDLQNFIKTAQRNGCEPTMNIFPSGIQTISSLAQLAGISNIDKDQPPLPTDILHCERQCNPKTGSCPPDWICSILRKSTPSHAASMHTEQ